MASEKPADNSELGMDVVCRFAGHLAHELNNLLTPIIACGQMLKDGIDKDHPLFFCAEQVAEAGDRCLELSRKLQIVGSRRSIGQVIDLRSLTHEAVKSVNMPSDRNIQLVMDPSISVQGDDLLTLIDMEQFFYLIREMLGNAAMAMPQGGKIQISIAARASAPKDEAETSPGGWVCLSIRDEGSGMTPEVQAQMYEPYFSTYGKERDKGLGLTLVYGIVRRAGGFMVCESSPGQGTTFQIYFPRKLEHAHVQE